MDSGNQDGSTGIRKRGVQRRASYSSNIFGKFLDDKHTVQTGDKIIEYNSGVWIVALVKLDGLITHEGILQLTKERFIQKYFRYRSKMVKEEKSGHYVFEELAPEEIDYNYHVTTIAQEMASPDISDEKIWTGDEIDRFIGSLNGYPYDPSKPLWRTILIPHLEAQDQSALIFCVNHAIGDGLSLVEVTFSLLDPMTEQEKLDAKKEKRAPLKDKVHPITNLAMFILGVVQGLAVPLTKPDPPNPLKLIGHPSPVKLVAATDPIELARVNEIKNKFEGATINDILMTLMTLTLKAYYLENNPKYNVKNKVSGQFPVSVRPAGHGKSFLKDGEPYNMFSYGYFNFEFDTSSRIDTVWKTKRQMDLIKLSPGPIIMKYVGDFLQMTLPHNVLMDVVLNATNIGTAQLSNVPGPQKEVFLDSKRIKSMEFFLFSPCGIYIGILSYNGTVNAAINLDGSIGVNPKDVAKHWKLEFDKLYDEVMSIEGNIPKPKYPEPDPFHILVVVVTFAILGFISLSFLGAVLAILFGR